MITRGVITYSSTSDKLKVYIPILEGKVPKDKIKNNEYQGIEVKSVISVPGLTLNYNPGDVVMVSFEDNEYYNPIILGYLQSAIKEDTPGISLKTNDLEVTGNLKATTNVSFGDKVLDFNSIYNSVELDFDLLEVLNTPI